MIGDRYFKIDYKTQKLIRVFESDTYKNWRKEDLQWEISQLNEYQFLYLLNKVISINLIENGALDCFFIYKYNEQKALTNIIFNFNKFEDNIYSQSISIENNIIELLYLLHKKEEVLFPLTDELESKLIQLKTKCNKDIHVSFSTNLIDYEEVETFDEYLDNTTVNIYDGYFYDINYVDAIRNELIVEYFLYSGSNRLNNQWLIDEIDNSCSKLEKLIPSQNSNNYYYEIIYPLCYSLTDWKNRVLNKVSICDSKEEFNKTKNYFIECLEQYNLLSGKDYINHSYIYRNNEKTAVNFSSFYSNTHKMKDWVSSLELNKEIQSAKDPFYDEIPLDQKIEFSFCMNQNTLVKILNKYFESSNIEFDKESIKSTIYHYTTIDLSLNKNRGYQSKFIEYHPLKKINFVPKKHTSKVIKIFLKMLDLGLIKTGKNKTFELLENIFSENIYKGFNRETIKYYWKNKSNLKVGNDDFWYYYMSILPNSKPTLEKKKNTNS